MKVVILGAGATAVTFPKVGAAAQFLERLDTVRGGRSPWASEYGALRKVVQDAPMNASGGKGLEEIWTHLDYHSKLCRVAAGDPDLAEGDRYAGASPQLKMALLEAYALHDEMPAVLENARAGVPFTLRTILQDLPADTSGSVLISFNWDTAGEQIANAIGKPLTTPPLAQIPDGWKASKQIVVVKPHGSLSWRHDDEWECRVLSTEIDGGPRLVPMRPDEVSTRRLSEPLVLGAVPIKSELFDRLQAPEHPKVYPTIFWHWAAVVRAIAQATELVVAGYGFPKEDGYGRFLIREGVARLIREKRATLPITYYSQGDLGDTLRDVFGDQASWTARGELMYPDDVKADTS